MSRTHKGSKGPGSDYWHRRAVSGNCGHGADVKKITHQMERARAKRDLRAGRDMPKREPF